ncbi:MAG: hypothetical protein FJ083_15110 [Cyanobacteria bacterium K_Offshore_surface_m2_239]|nr:hypothetical protein [Cyanobacteria bacterium K_Offshore_surface_m2_239]
MTLVLPGTQVEARGLAWEVVQTEPAGEQQRYRLRCLQGDLQGMEVDLLHPFEAIRPITTDFDPRRAGRLRQWQRERRERFRLRFETVRSAGERQERRSELGLGVGAGGQSP